MSWQIVKLSMGSAMESVDNKAKQKILNRIELKCLEMKELMLSQRYCWTDYWTDLLLVHRLMYTHPFNSPLSETTQVSRYQRGKTSLDCTEAWDSEWQWHQLGLGYIYLNINVFLVMNAVAVVTNELLVLYNVHASL